MAKRRDKNAERNDLKDGSHRFLQSRNASRFWLLALFVAVAAIFYCFPFQSLIKTRPSVILYAAQDQEYAEPILRDFERETGLRVRTVFDSEAAKTVALANRLLAERRHPQCDVFWGNEELRTRQLAAAAVFRKTNGWTAFGWRSRRLALGSTATNLPVPRSLLDLTNAIYQGRLAMAKPLFGTTATHFLALRQHWGHSNWLAWCHALAANQPLLLDGNSAAARFTTRGEASIALTDSDDIDAQAREGSGLRSLPLTAESLLIPNTTGVVRGCPHPEAAQQLFDYLQRPQVVARLVAAHALEGQDMREANTPTLRPDWDALLQDLEPATEVMKMIFRR